MIYSKLFFTIILLGFQFTLSVSAEIFKCKDASGKTSYSTSQCVNKAVNFSLKKDKLPAQTHAIGAVEKKPSVDIYITSWCPYCKKAMAYFDSNNIAYNAYDIEKDLEALAKKQKLAPGYKGVPLTVINGKMLKGFSEERFEQALKSNK